MFKALDRVLYDKMKISKDKKKPLTTKFPLLPLVDLACVALNWHVDSLPENLSCLPLHLVPKLLQTAIVNDQGLAVRTIIANWPFDALRFVE